jgi:hypothetical protein
VGVSVFPFPFCLPFKIDAYEKIGRPYPRPQIRSRLRPRAPRLQGRHRDRHSAGSAVSALAVGHQRAGVWRARTG